VNKEGSACHGWHHHRPLQTLSPPHHTFSSLKFFSFQTLRSFPLFSQFPQIRPFSLHLPLLRIRPLRRWLPLLRLRRLPETPDRTRRRRSSRPLHSQVLYSLLVNSFLSYASSGISSLRMLWI